MRITPSHAIWSVAVATSLTLGVSPLASASESSNPQGQPATSVTQTSDTSNPNHEKLISEAKEKVLSKDKDGKYVFDREKSQKNIGGDDTDKIQARIQGFKKFSKCVSTDSAKVKEDLDKGLLGQVAKIVFGDVIGVGKTGVDLVEAAAGLVYSLIDCGIQQAHDNKAAAQSDKDSSSKKDDSHKMKL
ncbi:hypothetical protein [Corynebacterium kroppenstedtii]|jgi:hypothetical protein|uniref:Secreted protein n=1 Tax=Corynebacterium kroppenstedtii TaxID=161879 RepID=A0A2W5V1T2_9CORY|nr:hypothetical protein [Corynebacterium kroppenstedtii]MDU7286546.1 hypothetical protein [Corynebacterium kroppenstedtii]PZR03931.1 MAG: hypothetical protein DI525_08485 [Corynebacterium kroppenstedtii]